MGHSGDGITVLNSKHFRTFCKVFSMSPLTTTSPSQPQPLPPLPSRLRRPLTVHYANSFSCASCASLLQQRPPLAATFCYIFQDEIVPDVLDRLRDVARREAELLFREHRNHPATPLPFISERISNAINSVTDAALKILDDASPGVSGG